jgi:glycerol kinase
MLLFGRIEEQPGFCDELKAEGKSDMIQQKTGLIIDAYFSATKVKWILDTVLVQEPGQKMVSWHLAL